MSHFCANLTQLEIKCDTPDQQCSKEEINIETSVGILQLQFRVFPQAKVKANCSILQLYFIVFHQAIITVQIIAKHF